MGRFILIGFSALLHAYVGTRLAIAFTGAPWALAGFVALLVLSTFMIPLSLIARRSHWGKFTEALAWVGMLFMGLFSSLQGLALLMTALLQEQRRLDGQAQGLQQKLDAMLELERSMTGREGSAQRKR